MLAGKNGARDLKVGGTICERSEQTFFCTPRFLFTGGYNWELNMENRVRFYCSTHTLTVTFKSSLVVSEIRRGSQNQNVRHVTHVTT